MEETISLKEILETLKKRWRMIALITAGAVILSAFISFFIMTPQYEASASLLVNQGQEQQEDTIEVGDIDTNVELINTYSVIISSPAILDLVIEQTGVDRTYSELESQVDVNPEGESQVVSVAVTDPDPRTAMTLADSIAGVFQSEVDDIMNIDNVSILTSATDGEAMSPVSPQPALNMAIAFVVGLMASVGLAFLLEFLDNTIKDEDDVEKELGLIALGSIPEMTPADGRNTQSAIQGRSYNVQKTTETN
ncbi:YveK family protein [Natribacillus halophilus]|uniref:Capsular polysaccharide biosynthesis protein n=1 Tax=Natribacillus halophilus TaxID=549003 RepID=A0A1G8KG23_9BACI|nr:Wzz/FepE/Etk N-terminal domain-containing protein [Natribacillus halophilus]SDI42345.1 Capsular polysaccharide biosynthesis protein [Natribacillus halophilus]